MEEQAERRSNARARLDAWVEITAQGVRRRLRVFDLSMGGMGIGGSPDELPRAGPAVCEFPLPGIGLPLEIAGAVAWREDGAARAGIRFGELDPGLAELLASFVGGRLVE